MSKNMDELPPKETTQAFRCTKQEKAAYKKAALSSRMATSDWIRRVLHDEIERVKEQE